MREEIDARRERIAETEERSAETTARLREEESQALNKEAKARRMAEHARKEQSRLENLERDFTRLKKALFEQREALERQRRREEDHEHAIRGEKGALRNLQSRVRALDADAVAQDRVVYGQDYVLQQQERRMQRIAGDRSEDEQKVLLERIRTLEDRLAQAKSTKTLLTQQRRQIEDDMRVAQRRADKTAQEETEACERAEEMQRQLGRVERAVKRAVEAKQMAMVDDNVTRLEAVRLKKLLNERADEVHSLGQRKVELETALEEREREIQARKTVLQAQRKAVEEQRHQATLELNERLVRVDRLRSKYEVVAGGRVAGGDETVDGAEHTQAYYMIKAAQQKEELQTKGNALDAEICKTEKEMRALENTLRMMNERNSEYRESLARDPASDELVELEQEYTATVERQREKRRHLKALHAEVAEQQRRLDGARREERQSEEKIAQLTKEQADLAREAADLEYKSQRTTSQLRRAKRDIRALRKVESETVDEKECEVKEQRLVRAKVVEGLQRTSEKHGGGMVELVGTLCGQAGVELTTTTSRTASRVPSAATITAPSLASLSSVDGSRTESARSQRSVFSSTSRATSTVSGRRVKKGGASASRPVAAPSSLSIAGSGMSKADRAPSTSGSVTGAQSRASVSRVSTAGSSRPPSAKWK